MAIAPTAEPPTEIKAIYTEHPRGSRLEISEEENQIYPISEKNAMIKISMSDDVAAVQYEPPVNRELQMMRPQVIRKDYPKCLSEDWRRSADIRKRRTISRRGRIHVINLCETADSNTSPQQCTPPNYWMTTLNVGYYETTLKHHTVKPKRNCNDLIILCVDGSTTKRQYKRHAGNDHYLVSLDHTIRHTKLCANQ